LFKNISHKCTDLATESLLHTILCEGNDVNVHVTKQDITHSFSVYTCTLFYTNHLMFTCSICLLFCLPSASCNSL